MERISEAAILDLWERCANRTTLERALALVSMACPEERMEMLVDWPIGLRDSVLLQLREKLFGEQLSGMAQCPQCSKVVELTFEVGSIRTHHSSDAPFKFETTGANGRAYHIDLRAISSRDFLNTVTNRNILVKRCIMTINGNDIGFNSPHLAEIPEDVVNACEHALMECDPQADVQLELICPDCEFAWEAPFDIASYLWREIEIWAPQALRQIHLLARAYGWTEEQILKLSPHRRRAYLGMVIG